MASTIHQRILKLVPQFYSHRKQIPRPIFAIAESMEKRGIPARAFGEAMSPLVPFIRRESDINRILRLFAADPNHIHLFRRIPDSMAHQIILPEKIREKATRPTKAEGNPPERPVLPEIIKAIPAITAKTLAVNVGLTSPDDLRDAEHHGKWTAYHREGLRMLASGTFLNNPLVQEGLRRSFHHTFREYNSATPGNQEFVRRFSDLGLNVAQWVNERYNQRFILRAGQIRELDSAAEREMHRTFYNTVERVLQLRGIDNGRVLAPLKNIFRMPDNRSVFDRVTEASQYFNEPPHGQQKKYRMPRKVMNEYLLDLISRLQRQQEKERQGGVRFRSNQLGRAIDELVSLQRVLAPHDEEVSLTDSDPHKVGPKGVVYEISKSSKDPIHWYTEGNDSGVCDATTGAQARKVPFTALNYAIQFANIYRYHPTVGAHGKRAPRKRVGQIRYYVGIEEGKPVLLINSIDFEAEERSNLALYRTAIDYSKKFAKIHGFSKLLLGKHGDMHLQPFDNMELFKDLRARKAHFELLHTHPADHAFSDFFTSQEDSRTYEKTKGEAEVYDVPLNGNGR